MKTIQVSSEDHVKIKVYASQKGISIMSLINELVKTLDGDKKNDDN